MLSNYANNAYLIKMFIKIISSAAATEIWPDFSL